MLQIRNNQGIGYWELSSWELHLLAMGLMLCDHICYVIFPAQLWMNSIGRLAFPIFAFLTVEGYIHTQSLLRYVLRLLMTAILSEVPFDLMVYGKLFCASGQNVLWTFLAALVLLFIQNQVGAGAFAKILSGILTLFAAFFIGTFLRNDYGFPGILTVLMFYYFRGNGFGSRIAQLFGMLLLHGILLGGNGIGSLFRGEIYFTRQIFAVLSLLPIWLYRGRQGRSNGLTKLICYSFYPVHMLVLTAVRLIVN